MTKNKSNGIKSWPLDDRPREKLLKKGAGTLSNSELLAILLGKNKAIDELKTFFKRKSE